MSLLETLMDRAGIKKVPLYARESYGFRAKISYSGDFRRIESISRRIWDTKPGIEETRKLLDQELKTPQGTMSLRQIQAGALKDICLYRGGLLPIGVGEGKALISLLAPVVLGAERPVLFVPAQLREQTKAYVLPEMEEHWNLSEKLRIIGYSELSLEKNADMLEDIRPDLIILDECHRVKNRKAGRTRRLIRYFSEHPETMCVAMSGTLSNRSLKDFAHISEWCLKGRSPLPISWNELTEWADALDEKVAEDKRVAPGALLRFCNDGENARQGFRRRLTETPGVVASHEKALGVSLRIERYKGLRLPSSISAMINQLIATWTAPGGDILTEAVDLWRHIRELCLGFYYRWDPAPPRDWMDARKAWKTYVRETLKHNRRNLDTDLQVWNECQRSDAAPEEWHQWKEIKDTFKPNSVPVWIDDFALEACREWLKDGGIIWTEHRAFGERLTPYFGAGDESILTTYLSGIVASRQAHAEGKNLQRYSRNLVVSPMASGKAWEQLLGRTHRQGQETNEVTCEVFLHRPELEDSFVQAYADARYLEDTFGNRQKLNYADIVDIQCQ